MTAHLLYSATFISAFLLFSIQPLYAKYLLSHFGGTASVWTISVFFFSSTLLLGYIYASYTAQWSARRGILVHGFLLLAAFLVIISPLLDGSGAPLLGPAVSVSWPAAQVFATLLAALGLPVVMLASTSVITQQLFARVTEEEPYLLYAVSNAGSLLGLLAYPFLIEPFLPVSVQAVVWSAGFVLFAGFVLAAWRSTLQKVVRISHVSSSPATALVQVPIWRIAFFASIPTFFLASATEFMSKGIASFPLLWIFPLALYLISFIVVFKDKPVKTESRVTYYGAWTVGAVIPLLVLLPLVHASYLFFWVGFMYVVVAFMSACLFFHQKAYDIRPPAAQLGTFYIFLTIGGALGSGLVGFVFPYITDRSIELPLIVIFVFLYGLWSIRVWLTRHMAPVAVRIGAVAGMMAAGYLLFEMTTTDGLVHSERNFYGTLQVVDTTKMVDGEALPLRYIVNGSIIHGQQSLGTPYEYVVGSYYGAGSGLALVFDEYKRMGREPRVVVLGLGAGVLSGHCDSFESLTYYEINPAVVSVAEEYFTYLKKCVDTTTIQVGDGRQLIEVAGEQGQSFDIIVADAFTDDAVPVHLLTTDASREAYEPALAMDGILAMNISNKYLNLRPVVAGMAREYGYEIAIVDTLKIEQAPLNNASLWAVTATPEVMETLISEHGISLYDGPVSVWTDEKNSVLEALWQ